MIKKVCNQEINEIDKKLLIKQEDGIKLKKKWGSSIENN